MNGTCEQTDVVARLREEMCVLGRVPSLAGDVPTDRPELNRILPGGGLRRGSLVELLGECGAETVAAIFTRALCRSPGMVVVMDGSGEFYPPALTSWGVPFERLMIVRPQNDADALWAADQALRSRAAVVVWFWRDRLAPHDFRRLRLSAEEGGAVGLLFKRRAAGLTPGVRRATQADLQLLVEPTAGINPGAHRTLRIEVTRCRNGLPGAVAEIDPEDGCEAPAVSATAVLADPAAAG
jgi:hypothetical protein